MWLLLEHRYNALQFLLEGGKEIIPTRMASTSRATLPANRRQVFAPVLKELTRGT